MSEPKVISFGCRLNTYESEVMRDHAQKAGIENAIIVNTCAVTSEAERQARQTIRKLRKENPDAYIIVTGCAVQVNGDKFAAMPEINRLLGNEAKMKPESFVPEMEARVLINDIMSVKETAHHLVTDFKEHARAFVQVQNGCDHRCTFCIIPYGRGPSRSVPIGEIVNHVRLLAREGYNEVVLTGVDLTSYGHDLPGKPNLGQMTRRLLALVPELPRLRISSIDPAEIDEDLFNLLASEPRLMPHLHLSLQAGDDMILKRMKRRHLRQHVIDFTKRAREVRPDVVFGCDIIAGFPTEDEAMFQQSLNIIEECGITYLHVFPYSERQGTPAAKMPQVKKPVRKERAERLRALGEKQVQQFLGTRIGKNEKILVERGGMGHTEHFAPVAVDAALAPGCIIEARIGAISNNKLVAQ